VELFSEPPGCRSNQWLNLLCLPDASRREDLLEAAHAKGLMLRPLWTPLHQLPIYMDMPRAALPVAEHLFARGACLPSSATIETVTVVAK
jgi:perosamine synthetase